MIVTLADLQKELSLEITKRKDAEKELVKLSQKNIKQDKRINKILKMADSQGNKLYSLNEELKEARIIADKANKAKSDFLSNMSHEIRTPMNSILGFTELLDEHLEDEKLKSFVKTIRTSGQTLLYLINDILDLSKIESGKLEIIKTKTNLQHLIEETLNIFSLQAEEKNLALKLDFDTTTPISLLLDQIRLQEVLINLVGNALKFTEKGFIKIIVSVDAIREHTSKIDLKITVQDTGIGIEESQIERIFNIFEQTENQNLKKYGGTGLGLSISRKLTHLMGGTLKAQSTFGHGASFVVKLNNINIASLDDEQKFLKQELDYKLINFKPALIIVVDDIKENRALIRESFTDTNIQVIEATNGKDAIQKTKKNAPDLILMDIRMPVMDGYTATRLIKEEFSHVPIVALTASIMKDELKKLDSARFAGYLRKPVSKNELFLEVAKHLPFTHTVSTQVNDKEKLSVEDKEALEQFLYLLEKDVQSLFTKAISSNDFTSITIFTNAVLALASKYTITYMVDYASLLLEKIDMFEIDEITFMLGDYEKNVKKLKALLP